MAEKGVVVEDAAAGESVACRDAVQNDDDANSRIIQLVDKAARGITYVNSSPIRTLTHTPDAFDIDPLPTDIASNLLDVSDAESVVIWGKVNTGTAIASDFEIIVTPIICSTDATPVAVAVLSPIEMRPVYPKKAVNSTLDGTHALVSAGGVFYLMLRSFPTYGATNMGFHCMLLNTNSTVSFTLSAAPSSCAYRDAGIDNDVVANLWGAANNFSTVAP